MIKRLIVECGEVLSLVALPVLFILVALVEKVTLLFNLIMVYVEGTIVDVELSILDLTGGIRGLEANESECITIWTSFNTNFFYFTISFEEISYFLLFPRIWEVFDIKITSSFAGFIANSFTKFFLLTIIFLQSMFDNKFQTISHITIIKFLDSFFSTFWSIFFVDAFFIIIADKTELTKFVLL